MLAINEIELAAEQPQESSERILEALDAILRSARFKESQQFQSLLRYIVSEAVKGNEDGLKERMIGIYVFGRRPDYDTTEDPIVRSRMGLLRKRLAQYYEGADGEDATVQIVIPNGTYRPSFTFRTAVKETRVRRVSKDTGAILTTAALATAAEVLEPPALVAPEVEIAAPTLPPPPRKKWRQGAAIAVAVAALIALGAWLALRQSPQAELDALWSPIIGGKQPIYVYTGSMPVFEKESPADEATSKADLYWPIRLPEPPAVDMPQTADHVFSYGEGMLTGSVYADIRIAGFLNKYNRASVMRSGSNLPFMDLKGSPLILVGSFDNYWTRVVNQDLPFYFDRGFGISERGGAHRRWHNPLKAEMTPRMMDDFALIFRVMDSRAGAPVLAVAGLSTCGTHAAADFVTDPAQMQALSGISRSDLRSKNIELVLHTSLVNCAPTSVQVIASKVW